MNFIKKQQMYLALLGRFYGSDNILRYTGTRDTQRKVGDLLLIGGNYAIALGDQVARKCDYELGEGSIYLAEEGLLSPQSIELCHRMVRERYTSYRKVLPLRISNDIDSLLKRKSQTTTTSSSKKQHLVTSGSSRKVATEKKEGQQCLIFPDLRTLSSSIHESLRKQKNIITLTSSMTEKQTNEARRAIKSGTANTVLCTPSSFFCDRHNLTDISIIDPHLRYYKSHQNPRFGTESVIKEIKEIYKIKQ